MARCKSVTPSIRHMKEINWMSLSALWVLTKPSICWVNQGSLVLDQPQGTKVRTASRVVVTFK
jgi:hypothetical protein